MGTSYLVTGAKLHCMWGSKSGTLVISEGHNVIASGRPKANCSDSRIRFELRRINCTAPR